MARIESRKGAFPHTEWVDLKDNGTVVEVAVVRRDENGNLYFFELNILDAIDRQRLFNIITKRHAGQFQLWDLLSQHTLGNGMNALDYFHQMVKVLTPSGTIIDPKAGVMGVRAGIHHVTDYSKGEGEGIDVVVPEVKDAGAPPE